MIRALEVHRDEDLRDFGRLLWQRRISHVIREDGPVQVIGVEKEEQVMLTRALYRQWLDGEIKPSEEDPSLEGWLGVAGTRLALIKAYVKAPMTLVLIINCVVVFVLTYLLGNNQLFSDLLFPRFARGGVLDLTYTIQNMTFEQFTRMFSPIFLHGGPLHLLFNMMWLWEFGRRIEARQHSWAFALVVLFIAFFSNWAQYIQQGSSNFVGISGVVAGLIGYIAMWMFIDPRKGIAVPGPMLKFFIIMIVVLALIDTFLDASIGISFIADTAHIVGLISGAVLGAVLAAISRMRRGKPRSAV